MGVSTDAILAFGFDLGEELPEAFSSDSSDASFEFDEWLQVRAGAVYPEGHPGIDSVEYRTYSDACKAALDACPVDLITHCSYDSPMRFLAIRGTHKRANRGYPVAITTPEIPPDAVAAMKAFCDEHGIEWQEPQWHIFSLWG